MQGKNQPLWTIGIVNYKSAVYIKWQLKILYEGNNPRDFHLIIVDNSNPHEQKLSTLIKPYRDKYKNVEIIYYIPKETSASGQHGEALSIIKNKVSTKYFLVQDPDFFWVQKKYLQKLETYLAKGYVAIGAPYPNKVGIGDPWFPAAYGCAFLTKELGAVDFYADVSEEKRQESFSKYPIEDGYEFSYDVGWKVRASLSSKPHLSFKQKEVLELKQWIGVHSFETVSKEYFLENKTIAFHLFRGTFTGMVTQDHKDPQLTIKNEWEKVRDKYGRFFYDYTFNYKKLNLVLKKNYFRLIIFPQIIFNKIRYSKLIRNFIVKAMKKTTLGRMIIKYLKIMLKEN